MKVFSKILTALILHTVSDFFVHLKTKGINNNFFHVTNKVEGDIFVPKEYFFIAVAAVNLNS